jgi:ribosomal protein S18 acetylase RimI-like enzyme
MSETRFALWHVRIWELYFEELVRSGMSEAAAKKNVEDNISSTMPNGELAKDNFVFEVIHDSNSIGVVWLWQDGPNWFIYDIDLEEEFRGKGLGRKTMHAIEEYVRARSGTSIGLSVFGFNEVARKLYESEGFSTVRISMKKVLVD